MAGREGQGRKLADWEVEELLAMRRRGASLREVADCFGLSERTVSRYLRRYGDDGSR